MNGMAGIATACLVFAALALAPRAHAGSLATEPGFAPVPALPAADTWVDVAPRTDTRWLEAPSSVPDATSCGGSGACAAPCAPPPCAPDPCRWRFSFTLPLWIPSISGSFASGGTSVNTGGSLGGLSGVLDRLAPDTSTSLEFFFMGRFAAMKGPWTLVAEGYYASLDETVDWKIREEDTTGSLDAAILRAYAAWQERSPLGQGPGAAVLAVGPYVGARAYIIDVHANPASGPSVDGSKSWIDPIVGVRADVTFRNGASIDLVADVGGVVTGSDPSWSFDAEISWPLGRHWAVVAGWTVLDIDYRVGSGDRDFTMNIGLSGPHVGVTYRF